jgi:uncharacterized protein YgiM (DUF1202 family)
LTIACGNANLKLSNKTVLIIFRKTTHLGDRKMRPSTIILIFIVSAYLISAGFAQESDGSPPQVASASDANQTNVPAFPYVAQITDDNVNIRSGPGTNYYLCGKLNKTDAVRVVGSQFSWSCIVPPVGSFSWISKQYVNVDANDPNKGVVDGDAVRVYAGAEGLKPIHSTTLQLKLNRGDKVLLLSREEGDYYKIAPPAGAYLWISTQYIRPLESIVKVHPVGPAKTESVATAPVTIPASPNAPPATIIAGGSIEAEKLKEYYALKKQFEDERAKPAEQQNYADLKKALADIAGNKDVGKAARYAEFTVKQIESCEMALATKKEVPLQDAKLQQIKEQIDKAYAARLAEAPDMGRFAVIGLLKTSNIYGPAAELKRYRITDDKGKAICYAVPTDAAAKMDLSGFVGKKVGLVGTIEANPQTQGAVVRFTEIAEVK